MSRDTISGLRGALVWALLSATTGGLATLALPSALSAIHRDTLTSAAFGELLTVLAGCVTVTGCLGLWASGTVFLLRAAGGRATSHRVCPRALQRMLLAVCGVALVGGTLATPAQATVHDGAVSGLDVRVLASLPLPDRAVEASVHVPSPRARPAVEHPPPASDEVVVRPGDTLWGLAAARLGPDATAAEIADGCRRIHAANRAVLGDDPDLIHPGARLRITDLEGPR